MPISFSHRDRPLVLVIDDEPLILDSLKLTLEAEGFKVATALGGISGLEIFRARHPVIVLTDILMPRGGGLETIAALRRARPDVKIIAMSGGGRVGKTEFVAVAAALGAHATIKKPFHAIELVGLLRSLLEPESQERLPSAGPDRPASDGRIQDSFPFGKVAPSRRTSFMGTAASGSPDLQNVSTDAVAAEEHMAEEQRRH
jgi:DNA-binding response OmpR family regulator